ncbi:MAG: SDR family NAD(P)-dependent oxidoreductase, partial [Oscillospiraceae bacterium]|nr:SDR family NAD(P)-dependent oxidoreductase [Oscillospiraceae bacterium]
ALNNAFRKYSDDRQFCGIGSAKSNVGHLVAASGPVGMMKVILSMKNRTLPASIHFEEPNPHISFLDSAMYVVDRATPWGTEGETLRAGVSSFGFSGTNVHVLLESAEAYRAPKVESVSAPRVLPISAKTKWSLEQYVSRYTDLLEKNSEIDLDSLCYTASQGRGHYNFRLAIPFLSYSDLKRKLNRLNYRGLENGDSNVYYGSYKVVSDKRMERGEGEYTESEIRATNRSAEEILSRIHAVGINMKDCEELCRCYIHGATIRWDALFGSKKPQKIHLPTYPFERTPYWADERVLKTKDVSEFGEANDHPLVERCLLKSIHQDIYITRFSVKKHWILHDHVIMGRNIIPGTAYVELAREVCSKYIDGEIELRDLVFMTPLAVEPNEEVEAQIVVTKQRGYVEFVVATCRSAIDADGADWIKHVEGKAYKLDPEACPGPFDLRVLETDPSLASKPVQLAGLDTPDAIMCFGPRWQNIKKVYVSPRDLYVHAKIDDRFVGDLETFQFHTSLLDATVNAGIQATMEGVYLPFLFKSLKLYRPLPQEVYSRAICKNPNAPSDETYTYDVQLMDKEGNILVDITDYTVKKVHKFNNYEDKSYYRIQWMQQDRQEAYEHSLGTTMVIGSQALSDDLIDRIEAVSSRLILVDNADSFAEIETDIYDVDCSEEGYRSLCAAISGTEIDTILYAGAYAPRTADAPLQSFEDRLDKGLYGLFHLTKALIKERIRGKLDIVVLTDHGAKVSGKELTVKPDNAALIGLAKCVVQEYQNLATRSIDTDNRTDNDQIMKELLNLDRTPRVALRGDVRYVEQLEKFDRDAQLDEVPLDLSEGCVLITGGTGGLGLEAAKYLAEKGASSIILLSRRGFPKEEQWDTILNEGTDKKLCEAIQSIRQIQDKDVDVLTVSADVSNASVMSRILQSLEKAFGKVVGVVHCAGVAGDGFLINKPFEVFRNVVTPKILGTKILDTLLNWEDVQLFVTYSSMTTLLGGPGQGDYTAANSYLDAYAQQGSLFGKPIVSLNWPAWSETGMAVDYDVSDAQVLFRSLDNSSAIAYLDDAISYRLFNVVPGELNYSVLAMIADDLALNLAPNIRKAVEVQKRRMQSAESGQSHSFNIQDVVILGKSAADLTHTEKQVAYIYAGVLSIEEIDIYENYNSLGGNSMTSTEILKILNQHFDNLLDVSDVFSYPTVFEMAEYIDSKLDPAKNENKDAGEPVTQLIDQLETGDIEIDKMIEYFDE